MHESNAALPPAPIADLFRRIACRSAEALGSSWAFMGALLVVVTWGASGPLFGFSDTWQLVINTGTTIVTFRTAIPRRCISSSTS